MRAQNHSIAEIPAALGVHRTTVYRNLKPETASEREQAERNLRRASARIDGNGPLDTIALAARRASASPMARECSVGVALIRSQLAGSPM